MDIGDSLDAANIIRISITSNPLLNDYEPFQSNDCFIYLIFTH